MDIGSPDINDLALNSQDNALLDQLRPQLEAADIQRQEKYATYLYRRKIALVLAMMIVPAMIGLFVWKQQVVLIWVVAIFGGGLYHWMTVPKRAYANLYKQSILPRIAAAYGLTYRMDGRIPDRELKNGGIMPSYDDYHCEDCFAGSYKGADLRFAEIKLTEERGSGKNRRTVTVFKGLAVVITLSRVRFYGHTVVVKNAPKMFEWMREKFGDLKRADLVDPVFEKSYSVFTDDQVEARYLLDPAMIERINNIGQMGVEVSDTLSIAYKDGCVYMMLPSSKAMFEPADISVPATDRNVVLSLRRQVSGLIGMIDQLEFYQPPANHQPS